MKTLLVGIAAAALAAPLLVAAPASADTPGCVSRAEYRQVHSGMTKAWVRSIFDTKGFFVSGGGGGYVVGYKQCRNTVPRYWWCQADIEYAVNSRNVARVSTKRCMADCSIG